MPVYIPQSSASGRSVNGSTTPSGLTFNPTTSSTSSSVPPYLAGKVPQTITYRNGVPSYVAQSLGTKVATQKSVTAVDVGAAANGSVTSTGGGLGQAPGVTTKPGVGGGPGYAFNMYKPIPTVSAPPGPRPDMYPPAAPKPLPPGNPFEYDWNLPPHKWSLPIQHTTVNEAHYTTNKIPAPKLANDSYRRGRLWWKANLADINIVTGGGKTTKVSAGDVGRKYGFQFLWNPESFGTTVNVNMDAYPDVNDRFLGVTGAFPGTEALSFVIRIDRTNDFACAATLLNRLNVDLVRRNTAAPSAFSEADVKEFAKFYTSNNSFQVQPGNTQRGNIGAKLVDLLQRGTLADIEYLYRAINGAGPGGANENGTPIEWMNGRGIKTADIGWLMPTLLHVDIGPLSYDGYVNGLQVNHTYFTPDMIPLRTDLTISLNILATAAVTSTKPQQS